jgi:hypothetical protein
MMSRSAFWCQGQRVGVLRRSLRRSVHGALGGGSTPACHPSFSESSSPPSSPWQLPQAAATSTCDDGSTFMTPSHSSTTIPCPPWSTASTPTGRMLAGQSAGYFGDSGSPMTPPATSSFYSQYAPSPMLGAASNAELLRVLANGALRREQREHEATLEREHRLRCDVDHLACAAASSRAALQKSESELAEARRALHYANSQSHLQHQQHQEQQSKMAHSAQHYISLEASSRAAL